MNRLHLLYQDKATMEDLMVYFEQAIREKASNDLFAGKDVSAAPLAKRLIDSVWDKMQEDFELDKKQKEITSR